MARPKKQVFDDSPAPIEPSEPTNTNEYVLKQTISEIVGNRVVWGKEGDTIQLTPIEAKALKRFVL